MIQDEDDAPSTRDLLGAAGRFRPIISAKMILAEAAPGANRQGGPAAGIMAGGRFFRRFRDRWLDAAIFRQNTRLLFAASVWIFGENQITNWRKTNIKLAKNE
jgi:hypothetical protein